MNILSEKRYKCLSGSVLKLLALVTMIIDHVGYVLLSQLPSALEPILTIGSHEISLYIICRYIGRLAFPIYSFLLVEGFEHTHSKKYYGINLLTFAFISEIPWDLMHNGTIIGVRQNVFFTLFFGFLGLVILQRYNEEKIKQSFLLIVLTVLVYFFRADYGLSGYVLILIMYTLKDNKALRAIVSSAILPTTYVVWTAFIPIGMYNGKRGFIKGKFLKFCFYAAYPIHFLVLYYIRMLYFGYSDIAVH